VDFPQGEGYNADQYTHEGTPINERYSNQGGDSLSMAWKHGVHLWSNSLDEVAGYTASVQVSTVPECSGLD